METTRVMTLGRVGALSPQWRTDFVQPPFVAPARPQNVLRQTFTSGIRHTARMLHGLGDVAAAITNPDDAVPAPPPTPGPLTTQSVAGPAATYATQNPVQTNMTLDVGQQSGPGAGAHIEMPMGRLALFLSLSTISGAVSAYHGYRRERGSWGAAFGWFMLGSMFPIVTPAVAFLAKPGFAKPRGR